jgi:2-polyprenyl-6-methoxyphenol hydroxylase-like FAD-dependent oxidoreductase
MRVLIIGAGTGGLALAHSLRRSAIELQVYERDLTPNADTGGYRVGISPAGSRALKGCVPPDLYDLFVATSARAPRFFNMLSERFSELLCLDLDAAAPDAMESEKNVIRKTLRRVLLSGLDDCVHFGKGFVSYADNPDGTITVLLSDGSSATGDVLVGADGTSSAVRRQRLPQARLEETGMASFGGKLPMSAESRALLTHKMSCGMSMIIAPRGFGAIIHSLEFAPNRTNPDFAKRWPSFMDALEEDSIGWGLWGARQNFPRDPAQLCGPELLRLALELTRAWHPNWRALLAMTHPETVAYINVRTAAPVPPWESSNVTLLGDAIHTMTPGRGAGANTALRDAQLLGAALLNAHLGRESPAAAIHGYEVEMLRYSAEAVEESKKQMDASAGIHRPIFGAAQLAMTRGAMRMINVLPPVKRRILRGIMRVRGEN